MTMSRRQWLGLFRQRARRTTGVPDPALETGDRPFALHEFYASRSLARTIPRFAIRAAYQSATTRVGTPSNAEVCAASGDSVANSLISDLQAIPDGLVPSVVAEACLAATSFCSVCVERCPVPGAIAIVDRRPRVIAAACDGCGECVRACPAPILAFELVARSGAS